MELDDPAPVFVELVDAVAAVVLRRTPEEEVVVVVVVDDAGALASGAGEGSFESTPGEQTK